MKELNKSTYNKKNLPVKIMQFGEGNFLRAFVDWMIAKANHSGVMNHGIVAVQPIEGGEEIAQIFSRQDCLYHVCLEGIKDKKEVREVTLVDSIVDLINPYRQYEVYEQLFLSEELEMIISNTTEAGIRYDEGDDIYAMPPRSFPAKMTALLYKRFLKYQGDTQKGLSVICCELIEDNGSVLKEYVLKHAEYNNLGDEFIEWIDSACYFYDTLVDRIVPGFPRENIDEIKAETGYNDNLVVKGEFFHVWAIGGDQVIKEKLPLAEIGLNVLFMDDIRNFRAKKVRVLNGAHTAMVPVALQLGCETVRDAFSNSDVETYINRLVREEVLPVIDEDPAELQCFADKILERFYNPFLKHYLKDISLNSLSKWETRDYPTVWDNYSKMNKKSPLTAFSLAALLVLYSGKCTPQFIPNDNEISVRFIQESFDAEHIEQWVKDILANKQIWKTDLSAIPDFDAEIAGFVRMILRDGMLQSVRNIIN